jgi:GxxExxY protein
MLHEDLTGRIIGAAITVHRELGPGLLESAYAGCLAVELGRRDIPFERQVTLPVYYHGTKVDCGYRLDMVVAGTAILELKSVEKLAPIHDAQLITYLKLSGLQVGLIINFNAERLTDGIRRLVLSDGHRSGLAGQPSASSPRPPRPPR